MSVAVIAALAAGISAPAVLASSGQGQVTLPFTGLRTPVGVALDRNGDVFVAGCAAVLELRAENGGYGQQRRVPVNTQCAMDVTFDRQGDLFVLDSAAGQVYELPATHGGFGPQRTLPFTGLYFSWSLAVDQAGNVYVADFGTDAVLELPAVPGGYGRERTLPFSGLIAPESVAVDQAGNVYVTDGGTGMTQTGPAKVLELIQAGSQAGHQVTLPFTGLASARGLAIDLAGDVFITDRRNQSATELPAKAGGYGPQRTLPFTGLGDPFAIAVSRNGSVFIADNGQGDQGHGDVVELPAGSAWSTAPAVR